MKRLECGFLRESLGLSAIVVCGGVLFTTMPALAGPRGAAGDLYISNRNGNSIMQVDSLTGEIVCTFATEGIDDPIDLQFGANGNLFVLNYWSMNVSEYDGNTGDLIGVFADQEFSGPVGLRFEENGNLLVLNSWSGDITEYDTSGELLGIFLENTWTDMVPMNFGPDGNLYISHIGDNVVQQFDKDGVFLKNFASGGGLDWPEGSVFGPNGHFFVASRKSNEVIEYDGTTGELIGTFIDTHLDEPTGLAFGPDGNLWVTQWGGGVSYEMNEFDGVTGAWIRTVTGLNGPTGIVVKPGTPPTDCLTMTVSSLTAGQNATWKISGADPALFVAVVYGFQAGTTIVNDQLGFCATFGIKGISRKKLVGSAITDGSGNATIVKKIPGNASGLTVLTQAAAKGTCPDECMSNLDTQVVQ